VPTTQDHPAVGRRPGRARRAAVAGLALVAVTAGACSSADLQEGGIPAGAGGSSLSASAVDASVPMLDEIVEEVMAETGIPGVAVAVVHDDRVVTTRGYGVREAGTDEPVDEDTVFQLASLSKPVGSTVISGLVGEGVVSWDDPIVEHLPDFELSDPWVTEHVTIGDMYAHRSGLPGTVAGNDLENMGFDRAEILQRLRYLPLDPFRITYSYSNFGMTTGGEAAARANGTTWETAAEEVLFEPAGMTSTSFRNSDFLAEDDRASLHVRQGGEWVPAFSRQPDAQAPAGGASSNVVDLARWMRLELNGGELDGEQIIDSDALVPAHTPQITSRPPADPATPASGYGYGWDVSMAAYAPGQVQWSHSGAFSVGAATTVRLLPGLDLGVMVLTNAAPVGGAEAIAEMYLDRLINGQQTQDWVTIWHERFAPLLEAPTYDEPATPTPQRAASAYVGTYENGYYGTIEIVEEGGELVMRWGPGLERTLELEHFDGDQFLYVDYPEIEGGKTPLAFQFGSGPDATALVLGAFEPQGDFQVLVRS